jgi:arylsulfatase A-like enzyme/Flp pilus assembly protein TadD
VLALLVGTLVSCRASSPPAHVVRPDVVLVTIDTWRADRLRPDIAPALHALAQRGRWYTNARSVAPLTLPAHTSLLTGMTPPRHGVRLNGSHRFDGRVPTLATLLSASGYRTGAFVGAYVLDRRFGLGQGFDEYDDRIARIAGAAERLEAERPAADVIDRALLWWHTVPAGTPALLWVHLYDPHAPYAPPADALARAHGVAYDGEVAYVDGQVARLLAAVAERGRPAVVAVAGDHGESLGEHGEATHGMLLYDGALRVPLVVSAPGLAPGRDDRPVSLVDVMPTVLGLAGVGIPAGIDGTRLDDAPGGPREVYAETEYPRLSGWSATSALIDERWKVIDAPRPELYDLSRDTAESTDLASAHASRVTAMRRRLAQLRASAAAPQAPAVSDDAAERLRSLGYASGAPLAPSSPSSPNPVDQMASWRGFEALLARLAPRPSREVIAGLQALASRHPESPVMQSTLARALADAGRHAEALGIYRRAVARFPADPQLFHDLAVAARAAGARDEALRAEEAALVLDPTHALAHNGRGLLLVDAGRLADARAAFARAAAIDPTNAQYRVNLANAAGAAGDVAGAERAYRDALALDARAVDALNGLAVLLVRQGQPRDGVALLRRALEADGRFVEARLNLGIACQESGDLACAREAYRSVLRDAPARGREYQAAMALLSALE